MILLAAILLIVFEALLEGLSLRGHKTIAGFIEGIYRAVITLIVFAWLTGSLNQSYEGNIYLILAGYVLLRFAVFDFVYNLTAGLPLFYIGKTKLLDKFWNWILNKLPWPAWSIMGMLKLITFCLGVTWLMNWQHGIK